jgi:hypothetical protein
MKGRRIPAFTSDDIGTSLKVYPAKTLQLVEAIRGHQKSRLSHISRVGKGRRGEARRHEPGTRNRSSEDRHGKKRNPISEFLAIYDQPWQASGLRTLCKALQGQRAERSFASQDHGALGEMGKQG